MQNTNRLTNYSIQILIATVLKKNYDSMNKQSLQILTSIFTQYILQVGKVSKHYANYAGRCQVQLEDVLYALTDFGIDFTQLIRQKMRHDSMYELVDVEEKPARSPPTQNQSENIPTHLPDFPQKDLVKTSYTPAQVDVIPFHRTDSNDDSIITDAPDIPPRLDQFEPDPSNKELKSLFDVSKEEITQALYTTMKEVEVAQENTSEELESNRKTSKLIRKQLYMDALKRHPLLHQDIGSHSDQYQYMTLFPFSPHFEMPNSAQLSTSCRASYSSSRIPPGWLLAPYKINLRPPTHKKVLDFQDVNDLLEDDGNNEQQDREYRNSYLDAVLMQSRLKS
eukprot:NODE_26_length_40862_cov_0.679513.p15 type:complete len:337 gc:universal NODE_26_length_40862_cov_0.679513:16295-17305(+)